jgi:hypothetical protein
VAWADGSITREEKAAVLRAAEARGIKSGSIERGLLEEWLERKPSAELIDAWSHYIAGLCDKLTEDEKAAMKKEIVGGALAVAQASGGVLGINKISPEEKAVVTKMEKAFG